MCRRRFMSVRQDIGEAESDFCRLHTGQRPEQRDDGIAVGHRYTRERRTVMRLAGGGVGREVRR